MRTIQYGLVNSAVGQIPCSTKRISCWNYNWSITKDWGRFRQLWTNWRRVSFDIKATSSVW